MTLSQRRRARPAALADGGATHKITGKGVLAGLTSLIIWPGIGQAVASAILAKDFAVVETFILLSATAYVVVNLVVDLSYSFLDPRVTY